MIMLVLQSIISRGMSPGARSVRFGEQRRRGAGSYLRLIDSYITQCKAQGPSRTCNESKEEEEEVCDSVSVNPLVQKGATP